MVYTAIMISKIYRMGNQQPRELYKKRRKLPKRAKWLDRLTEANAKKRQKR